MFVMKSPPPPPRSSAISFAIFALLFVTFSASHAVTFNGREYTQYSSQWFEVYQGDTFRVVGTEIFVYFTSSATQTQIDALNASLGGETIKINCLGTYLIQSTASPAPDPLDFMESYLNSSIVTEGSNNTYLYYLADDPSLLENSEFLQRYLYFPAGDDFDNSINPDPAWELTTGSSAVKVGILDGGVFWQHSQLRDNIWKGIPPGGGEDADEDGQSIQLVDGEWVLDPGDLNNVDDDGNGLVDDLIGWSFADGAEGNNVGDEIDGIAECRHGTPVAGIIGARTNDASQFAGIAGGWGNNPGTSLVICKMSHTNFVPMAAIDEAIDGLNYLINQNQCKIINCSWYSTVNGDIQDLLFQANAEDNICIVFAASRPEGGNGVRFPARDENVLAVGGSEDGHRLVRSAVGDDLDIVAPCGVAESPGGSHAIVYSTSVELEADPDFREIEADPLENPDLCSYSGVSFAAPQASGVVALLLSQVGTLSVNNLHEILGVTSARDDGEGAYNLNLANHPYGGWNSEIGYGELNAANAVVYGQSQGIGLYSGWQLISSRIEPFRTADNLLDDENGILLSWREISDASITVLKNYAAQTWDGSQNPANCNIPSWNPLAGYKVNMSVARTLVILGKELPLDTEIELNAGWNWVSYLPDFDLEAGDAFESLIDQIPGNLNIVKNGGGQFYIPGGFNNIPDCSPGEGFEVSVDGAAIRLDYPDQQPAPKRPEDKLPPVVASDPEYFSIATMSDYFHPLLITGLSVEGLNCASGDEVAVFTGEDICIGAAVYGGQLPMGVAIWRDDPTTETIDGYRNGDLFLLKYWSVSEHALFGPDTLDTFGDLDVAPSQIYTSANIAFGRPAAIVPTSFAVSQPYPNPFNMNSSLRFELPEAGILLITIHDASGRLVKQSEINQTRAGYFIWTWNGNDMQEYPVTSGMYFCKIDYATQSGDRKSATSQFTAIR